MALLELRGQILRRVRQAMRTALFRGERELDGDLRERAQQVELAVLRHH